MNALPAVALTCGSEVRPRRAPRPSGHLRRPADPRPPRHAQRSGHPHFSGHPRDPGAARGDTPAPPLRLTRRGRVVVAAAAALLVTMLSLLAAGVAQATSHAPSPHAARQHLVQVVVRPGQSLWSVAESTDPDQDTRAVIRQIIDLNALSSDVVFAGQQLWVPRG